MLCLQICLVFGHLWSTNDALLRKRLLLLLHQHGTTLSVVRAHLDTLLSEIEDGDDEAKVCTALSLRLAARARAVVHHLMTSWLQAPLVCESASAWCVRGDLFKAFANATMNLERPISIL